MKIWKTTLLIFSTALLTAACSKDAIEEVEPTVPSGPVVTKTLSLSIPETYGAGIVSRADGGAADETVKTVAATADEKQVKGVFVLQYAAGGARIISEDANGATGYYTSIADDGTVTDAELSDEKSTIYVLANFASDYFAKNGGIPTTLSALEAGFLNVSAMTAEDVQKNGLPMVGCVAYEPGTETSVKIDMARLFAKIKFTAKVAAGVTLSSIKLEDLAKSVSIKEGATTAATDHDKDTNFTDLTATSFSGSAVTWYVPENLAGENTAITAPKYKGPQNAQKNSTRIVINGKGTYKGTSNSDVNFYIYPGGDATKSFDIKRNYYYEITADIKKITPSDKRIDVQECLSPASSDATKAPTGYLTSNCYMINHAGRYKFNVGNGGNGVTVSGVSYIPDMTAAGLTLKVFWQESSANGTALTGAGDVVIKNCKISDNSSIASDTFIEFETADPYTLKEGNALIALVRSGSVVWSWHIWATAYNPDAYCDNYKTSYAGEKNAGLDYKEVSIMRCNLGACGTGIDGKTPADGLWYQWGRKDPFRHQTTGGSNQTYAYDVTNNGAAGSPQTGGDAAALEKAIHSPQLFYTSSSSSNGDWTTKNNGLWGNDFDANDDANGINSEYGVKTMFDPCPLGWKVAPQGTWQSFTVDGQNSTEASHWNSEWGVSPAGRTFWFDRTDGMKTGLTTFYPASGCLRCADGTVDGVGADGYSWSSSPYSSSSAYAGFLYFGSGSVYPLHYTYRAYGVPVRCVRE